MSSHNYNLSDDGGSGDSWHRVSKQHPCPVCGKPDWCSAVGLKGSPDAVVCMREPSDNKRPIGGWLHQLRDRSGANRHAQWPTASTQPRKPLGSASRVDTPSVKTFQSVDELLASWQVRLGKPSIIYRYENQQAELVGLVARWDRSDGKTIRQACLQSDGRWSCRAMSDPKPLYRLPELLASDQAIYLVEGEKCVDALAAIGVTATTWPGGSSAVGKADLSPLVGRRLVLLPDNDSPGQKAMHQVIDQLSNRQPSTAMKLLELPNLPAKGDVVDWINSHGDAAEPETIAANLHQLANETECLPVVEADKPLLWRPFPSEVLPEPLRSFVIEGANAIGCDESYLAMPALAALASAIGTTRCLQVKRGWEVPAILWTVIIGESGSSKTPAFSLAMSPLYQRQRKTLQRFTEAESEHQEELAFYEKSLAAWKRDKKTTEPPPSQPAAPQAERCVVSDTTVEALAPILLANQRGLLVDCDELSSWFGSFDRYTSGKGSDSAHWLKMYNHSDLVIDRKTGTPRTISIPAASISITGGIQPGILRRSLSNEHRESGLAARLLLAYPPRKEKKWTESEINPTTELGYQELVDKLFTLKAEADGLTPKQLNLSPEAKHAWIEFVDHHGEEQADLEGDLSAAWSKLEEVPARLALVFHLIRWAYGDLAADGSEDDLVGIESMVAAIRLTEWFKSETKRIYSVLNESEAEQADRRLTEWIVKREGSVTISEAQKGCRWLKKSGEAELALNRLSQLGVGSWETQTGGPKGGRPKRIFILNGNDPST